MKPDQPKTERLYFIDWVRVMAFALLVFYHTGLIFEDGDFHIHNKELSRSIELPLIFLSQWRLPLLFLVSGIGIAFSLSKRSPAAFIKERFIRLLIPLVFGIFIVVAPQVYFQRMQEGHFSGSYLQFYPHFFDGVYPEGNFTWNHLWFIAYLFVYCLLALPVLLFLRSAPGKLIIINLHNLLSGRGVLLFVFIIPLLITEITLRHRWPNTRDLIHDWYNFAFYILVFLYGYIIASGPRLFQSMERDKWVYLFSGCLSFILNYSGRYAEGENYFETSLVGHRIFQFLKCCNILCWMFAFIGFAKKYLYRANKILQYSNRAVYPFYILHQTVIIAAGYYVVQWRLPGLLKYFLIVFLTFLVSMLLYEFIIRRVKWIAFLFGLKSSGLKSRGD